LYFFCETIWIIIVKSEYDSKKLPCHWRKCKSVWKTHFWRSKYIAYSVLKLS
jgi:hypothetical protein